MITHSPYPRESYEKQSLTIAIIPRDVATDISSWDTLYYTVVVITTRVHARVPAYVRQ